MVDRDIEEWETYEIEKLERQPNIIAKWEKIYPDSDFNRLADAFEQYINAKDISIKNVNTLHKSLDKWMTTDQPSQNQMDFFTELYDFPYLPVEKVTEWNKFYYKHGSYARDTKEFWHVGIGKRYITEEKIFHLKYGDRVIVRDKATKKILSHLQDVRTGIFLAPEKQRVK